MGIYEGEEEAEAARSVIAALCTYYFDGSVTNIPPILEGNDPALLISCMLGLLVGSIDAWCEETGEDQESYIQRLGMRVALETS